MISWREILAEQDTISVMYVCLFVCLFISDVYVCLFISDICLFVYQ